MSLLSHLRGETARKERAEEHIFGFFQHLSAAAKPRKATRNILQCRKRDDRRFSLSRCILLLESFVRLTTQSALCSPPELISYCAYLIIIFIKHPECRDVTVFQFESLPSRARAILFPHKSVKTSLIDAAQWSEKRKRPRSCFNYCRNESKAKESPIESSDH